MYGKDIEDLGTLKEFCEQYGECEISLENINEYNITLTVISNQEIEFKILCSNALSEIIRNEKDLPENLTEYHVVRVTGNDKSYIRVSQSITLEADPNLDIWENMGKVKELPGNISIRMKVEDLKVEPIKPIKLEDIIKL